MDVPAAHAQENIEMRRRKGGIKTGGSASESKNNWLRSASTPWDV
jgi:hypothetical protein